MRRPWRTVLVFTLAACSGEPFSSSTRGTGGSPVDAGVAGTTQVPPAPAAGGGALPPPDPAPSEGGAPSGEPAPAVAGEGGADPGATAGAPGSSEGGAAAEPEPECPSRTGGDWSLGFFPELLDTPTVETHPFFQIANVGAAATSLDRVELRYYFTRESDVPETPVCYWVTGDRCSRIRMRFKDLPRRTPVASRYLEVTFPGASDVTLFPGTFEVRVGFKTGASPMIQSNDYSFDPEPNPPSSAAPFPYKRWQSTTLYLGGELVWGSEPCPRG
jgi:Cellulose binding domain